eukprot:s464_g4.t1
MGPQRLGVLSLVSQANLTQKCGDRALLRDTTSWPRACYGSHNGLHLICRFHLHLISANIPGSAWQRPLLTIARHASFKGLWVSTTGCFREKAWAGNNAAECNAIATWRGACMLEVYYKCFGRCNLDVEACINHQNRVFE